MITDKDYATIIGKSSRFWLFTSQLNLTNYPNRLKLPLLLGGHAELCKFVRNHGAWKIQPPAYGWYSEGSMFRATPISVKAEIGMAISGWAIVKSGGWHLEDCSPDVDGYGFSSAGEAHGAQWRWRRISWKRTCSSQLRCSCFWSCSCPAIVRQYRKAHSPYPECYDRSQISLLLNFAVRGDSIVSSGITDTIDVTK